MLIGLSGKYKTGKTSITNHLLQSNPDWVRLAFGDLLKEEVAEVFGIPLEWCYTQEGKNSKISLFREKPLQVAIRATVHIWTSVVPSGVVTPGHWVWGYDPTVREVLQFWGTEYRRKQDPDYWVKALLKRYQALPNKVVVIDDVRFPNEALSCLYFGGLFRLEPHSNWIPGEHANHVSETALDYFREWDCVYYPEGKDELKLVADNICDRTSFLIGEPQWQEEPNQRQDGVKQYLLNLTR